MTILQIIQIHNQYSYNTITNSQVLNKSINHNCIKSTQNVVKINKLKLNTIILR